MDHASGVISKKSSPNPRSSSFSHMLPSGSCSVLHFTVRSVIHFKLIFVKGVRSVLDPFFFSCMPLSSFRFKLN